MRVARVRMGLARYNTCGRMFRDGSWGRLLKLGSVTVLRLEWLTGLGWIRAGLNSKFDCPTSIVKSMQLKKTWMLAKRKLNWQTLRRNHLNIKSSQRKTSPMRFLIMILRPALNATVESLIEEKESKVKNARIGSMQNARKMMINFRPK